MMERIKAIDSALSASLQNMLRLTLDQDDVNELNEMRAKLKEEKAAITARLNKLTTREKAEKVISTQGILEQMYEKWDKEVFKEEDKLALVNTILRHVTLKKLSAHFFRVTCTWEISEEPSVIGVWYAQGDAPRWTETELEMVRDYWPDTTLKEILARRSWDAIHAKAYSLGVAEGYSTRWYGLADRLTTHDRMVMQQYNIAEEALCEKGTLLMNWSLGSSFPSQRNKNG